MVGNAQTGRLDHIPPVKRTFIYLSITHRINSGAGWSICTGGESVMGTGFSTLDQVIPFVQSFEVGRQIL